MSTINLKAAEVQVRENRLGSITGFKGTAAELVQCAKCGELTDSDRSFSQCLGCSTSNATCAVALIQDSAVISHGPVGCAGRLHDYGFTYRVNGKHRGVADPHAASPTRSKDASLAPTWTNTTRSTAETRNWPPLFARSMTG